MAETVDLRGEGGAVIRFSLPLRGPFADQFAQGKLKPATDADARALKGASPQPEPTVEAAERKSEAVEAENPRLEAPPKVGKGSDRDSWASYAEAQGIDTDGLSRAEIIRAVEQD